MANKPKKRKSGKSRKVSKKSPARKNVHKKSSRPKSSSRTSSKTSGRKPASQKKRPAKKRLKLSRLLGLGAAGAVVVFLALYGLIQLAPTVMPVISQITNNEKTAPLNTISHEQEVREIQQRNALDEVDVAGFSDQELRKCFFSSDLDEKLTERLHNMGYADQIPTGSLKYVRVLYRDFDGRTTVGELMVNAEVAQAVENIFFDLFLHKYPIGKMILPDAYGTRISESYADNNTVALCFGLTEDNKSDLHSKGYAVDLNPLYNPLIKDNGLSLSVFPMEGQLYLDRTVNSAHFIYPEDYAVKAFEKEGFVWKGKVRGLNDYKHFEYSKAPASPAPASSSQSSQTGSSGSEASSQSSSQASSQQPESHEPAASQPSQPASSQASSEALPEAEPEQPDEAHAGTAEPDAPQPAAPAAPEPPAPADEQPEEPVPAEELPPSEPAEEPAPGPEVPEEPHDSSLPAEPAAEEELPGPPEED